MFIVPFVANSFVIRLGKIEKFDNAEIAALSLLTGRPRRFAARSDLIREGDAAGPVFVMLEGWACRYKILRNGTRQITAFLMPGDMCDLHPILWTEVDHSVQTLGPARVAIVPRSDLYALMMRYPRIGRAVYANQLITEGITRSWMISVGRRSSVERIAHLMCELYHRAQAIGLAANDQLDLPVSQIMLADALGLTPVHINRVLKNLRAEGIMGLQRSTLTVTDPVALARIAGFDDNYLSRRAVAA